MRALGGLIAGCVLAACGGPAPLPQTPPITRPPPVAPAPHPALPGLSRRPSAAESSLIRQLAAETERLRGLRFRQAVDVRVQDRVAMRAYVDSALDADELARARRRYLALGLLPEDLDVHELIVSLMEEELVGYYDPEQKLLAVRNDVADALSQQAARKEGDLEWRATVVHELVHALQDQHLALSRTMQETRTTDEENVYGAVIEGDATLVMLGYVAERQGGTLDALVADTAALARSLHESPLSAGGRLARAPALVREPLLFRYREGAVYAARLFARAGWQAVNEAHRKLPASTLVVREPSAQLAPFAPPDPDTLVAPTCRSVDRDVLGSLEVGAALASPGLASLELARAWRGDRYSVLDCGGDDASIWFLRFSTPAIAKRTRAALLRPDSQGKLLRSVQQQGTSLLVTRRLAPDLVRAIEAPFRAWASAGR